MSAIAARKARLALEAEGQGSSSSSSSDPTGPSSIPSTPKRKALVGKVKRPTKVSRQQHRREEPPKDCYDVSQVASGANDHYSQQGTGEGDEDDDDSSDESNVSTDVEKDERPDITLKKSSVISSKPVCSTLSPILDGKRKNWHIIKPKKPARQGIDVETTTSLIVGLAPNQTLLFVGKVRIKVLDGQCTIAGACVTSHHRSVSIFAPQNAPLPVLQARSGTPTCKAFPEFGFGDRLYTAVLQITSINDSGIDDIAMACPLVRSGCFTLPSASSPLLPGFFPVFQSSRGLVSSYLPPSWEQGLTSVGEGNLPSLCLIKGPKRVGKSTFSRYLLNRLVSTRKSSIAYLETDLGQAEFGPPGMIALHLFGSLTYSVEGSSELVIGPSWTSLRYPLKSHFLGDTTPRDDPASYNDSIADLLQFYNDELKGKGIPLIVNTQGWVKGLGADLLFNLEKLLQPTHVFDMMQYDEDSDLHPSVPSSTQNFDVATILRLEAAPLNLTRDRGMNAVEVRILNLVSYFYSTHLPGYRPELDGYPQWDFSLPLVAKRPYIVNVQQGLQAGLFVLTRGARVDQRLKLMALNGSCVAIVSTSQHQSIPSIETLSIWKEALSREMPSLQSSTFLSLAIVRSIDVARGEIHLVTPLSINQLQPTHGPHSHLYLVKGAVEVPIWLSLNYPLIEASQSNQSSTQPLTHLFEGVPLSEVPFLDFAPENNTSKDHVIGQEKRKVRRNILRRSQRGGPV